jgi:hypothetical protein
MHVVKTYTYNIIAEALKLNNNFLSMTYDFYMEITVTTNIQHLPKINHKHTSNHNHIYAKIAT